MHGNHRFTIAAIKRKLRDQSIGVAIGLLALFVALGGPSYAVDATSSATSSLKRALKLAKAADKRSKQALRLAQRVSAQGGGATGAQGPAGAQGPTGPAGSPDSGADVLAKLLAVDGAGSGLDADLLDGVNASTFLTTGSIADGDVSGQFSNLQLDPDVVTSTELADNAVGSAHVSANSLRVADLAMTIHSSSINLGGTINNGACSASIDEGASGAASNNLTVVYSVRGAGTPGWSMKGEVNPSADEGRYRICNDTGANADPPNLTFDFFTIGQ
jgi:hypothetical protein